MKKTLVSMVALVFCLTLVAQAEDNNGMLTFVQNGVSSHIQIIQTASMKYYTTIGSKGSNFNGKWYLKGANIRALEASLNLISGEKSSFKVVEANQCRKSLHYDSKGRTQGAILSDEPAEFAYTNPGFLFLEIFRTNIVDVLKDKTAQYAGKETIDGQECYIITGQIRADRRYKVWIAPERDFRPLRIDLYYGKEGGQGSFMVGIHNIKLEKIDGIWFPIYADKTSTGAKDAVPVAIRISEVKLNKSIPDDVFDIKFPPGTRVVDSLLMIEYTVPE